MRVRRQNVSAFAGALIRPNRVFANLLAAPVVFVAFVAIGEKNRGESAFLHRTVRMEFDAQMRSFRRQHERRLDRAAIAPMGDRNFAVGVDAGHFDVIVFAILLKNFRNFSKIFHNFQTFFGQRVGYGSLATLDYGSLATLGTG